MKRLSILLFLLSPALAHAQEISGPAIAIDGDSLDLSGIIVRLHGVDAPEFKQNCTRGGSGWACGKDAAVKLASLINGKSVSCSQHDLDNYERIVASCRVGNVDLGLSMIDAGLAVALPHFTDRYVSAEARARAARVGLWGAEFQPPADYRATNPAPRSKPRASASMQRETYASPRPSAVFYRNCNDARAAGAAPLYRGQPGYRPEMDGDGDGIACEPYRGR